MNAGESMFCFIAEKTGWCQCSMDQIITLFRGWYILVHRLDTQSKLDGFWLFFVRLSQAHKRRKETVSYFGQENLLKQVSLCREPKCKSPIPLLWLAKLGATLPQKICCQSTPCCHRRWPNAQGVEIRAWLLQVPRKSLLSGSFWTPGLRCLHHTASKNTIPLAAVLWPKLRRYKFVLNRVKLSCTGSPLSGKSWQTCRSLILLSGARGTQRIKLPGPPSAGQLIYFFPGQTRKKSIAFFHIFACSGSSEWNILVSSWCWQFVRGTLLLALAH